MKHSFVQIIFGAIAIFLSVSIRAQDIIVTTDAKKIEAKITEVSKSEIKYKEFDYQDGPTFTLGVEEINSIIYANGKVALYNQDKAKKENQETAQEAEEDEELKAWIEESDKLSEAKSKALQGQIAQDETGQNVIVDFGIEPMSNPLMYRFPNLSSGATEFRWDFGDGTFSFAKDAAIYCYDRAGTYTVTLTASVGDRQYIQRKTLEVGGSSQQEQTSLITPEAQELLQESVQGLSQSIKNLVAVKNSYALDVKNTTKHPYRINLDGHILGVVNPYKTERFIVSVEIYGRLQAVQTSGYVFSPTIKEFKIPRQQKQTACTVVIK